MDLRFEFARDWRMMYLSHLDLMHVFARAIRRGRIPVRYSEGFNPHADMVFGLPLQVGVTADAECLDLALERDMDAADAVSRLSAQLPPGLFVRAAAEKKSKANAMAMITHAAYIMRVTAAGCGGAVCGIEAAGDGCAGGTADGIEAGCAAGAWSGGGADGGRAGDTAAALARAVEAFLAPGPRCVLKETKKTSREIDLAPLVRSLEARGDAVVMTVRAGSVDNVKPDLVLAALNNAGGAVHGTNGTNGTAGAGGGPLFCRASLHRAGIFVERGGVLLSPLEVL